MTAYPTEPLRAARRSRHRGRGWLIFLAVLVVLLVAADRVAEAVAGRVAAAKVQQSQHLSHKPKVTFEGFPFLTQVIGNHYQAIQASGTDITVGDSAQQVTLTSFRSRLSGVRTIDNFHGVTADQVTGTANLGYDQLSAVLGVPLSYAAGGRLQTSRSVDVLGRTVTGMFSAVVTVPGGDQLAFSDVRVAVQDVGIGVPSAVTSQLSSIFSRKLSLTGLPFGLRITELTASKAGVEVSAVAAGVRFE